jgi:hypothetical protein
MKAKGGSGVVEVEGGSDVVEVGDAGESAMVKVRMQQEGQRLQVPAPGVYCLSWLNQSQRAGADFTFQRWQLPALGVCCSSRSQKSW